MEFAVEAHKAEQFFLEGRMTSITIRLIFVNYDGKPTEITAPVSWCFRDLKKYILSDKWPENFVDISQVERLRLFSSGKELDDPKSVNDLSQVASHTGFAPVHVTAVNKSARQGMPESTEERSKASFGCQCAVM